MIHRRFPARVGFFGSADPNSPGGSWIPRALNRGMNVGRRPVDLRRPSTFPSTTPVCSNAQMSPITIQKEDEFKQALAKGGVTFVQADTEAYRKATLATYKAFPKWTPGLYERVQAAMK